MTRSSIERRIESLERSGEDLLQILSTEELSDLAGSMYMETLKAMHGNGDMAEEDASARYMAILREIERRREAGTNPDGDPDADADSDMDPGVEHVDEEGGCA